MKCFQVLNEICHWDATNQFPTVESTIGYFPPDLLFVEAPDYVFEGWGYVDGEFIKPEPPEGWVYDENTGTFYPEDFDPNAQIAVQSEGPTMEQMLDALLDSFLD